MDNIKTGAFIKALRTELGLTQRELAERLHITDRAVSKWERGLSAPGIDLLEPLAEILRVSMVELIRGERLPKEEFTPAMAEQARELLVYSRSEVRRTSSRSRGMALLIAAACLLAVSLAAGAFCWKTGILFVLDRCPSPDGAYQATVYSKELASPPWGFSWRDAVSVIDRAADGLEWRAIYGNCTYQGLWWSPDSGKYVLALDYDGVTRLCMARLKRGSMGELNAYLDMAVGNSGLTRHGIPGEDGGWGMLDVEYQFIQWSPDGDTMLIRYAFTGEQDGKEHTGFFWFDCEKISLSGLFELEAEREPGFVLTPEPSGG